MLGLEGGKLLTVSVKFIFITTAATVYVCPVKFSPK